jgi:hypothetical protein
MDDEAFDQLTHLLGRIGTRRAALGALLSTGVLGTDTAAAKRRQRNHRQRRLRAQALPGLRDCPHPGPGQDLSRCDFNGQDLVGVNLRGANLSGANVAGADLCGADLRGANLHRTDVRFATLTRVDFRGTNLSNAKLANASFCRTRKPNGTRDNTHCPPAGTALCCADAECADGLSCHLGRCLLGDCETCGDRRPDYYRARFQYCLASIKPGDCDWCTDWMGCIGSLDTQTSCGTVEGEGPC